MKIGIYEKAINKKFSWEEKIIIAKKAGYDFIEFSIDESDEKLSRLDWTDIEINNLKHILIKHNFYFNSMTLSGHRKYPFGSKNPDYRLKANQIMEKAISLSLKLGIRNIQLAGYDVYYEISTPESKEFFLQGMKKAANLAMQNSIMLSIEVMDTEFMGTVTKIYNLIKKINSPWLTIYPDCGNLFQWSKDNFTKEILLGKDKIIAAHFKDTKPGVFKNVEFGKGTVNFTTVFNAFKLINFQGPWLIEMWSKNSQDESMEQNILYIRSALNFFNKHRKGIL